MSSGTDSHLKGGTELSEDARNFSVKDLVVLVTGSGQGIGRELVRQFAAAGAIAVVADLSMQHAQTVVAEIEASGGKALALQVDVSKKEPVDAMVRAALEKYAGKLA